MTSIIEVKTNLIKTAYLNGEALNQLDFGEIHQTKIETNEKNISEVTFRRKFATEDVLLKYGIDLDMYNNIGSALEEELESVLY